MKKKNGTLKRGLIFSICLVLVAAFLIAGLILLDKNNEKPSGTEGSSQGSELPKVDFGDLFK